MSRPPAHSAHWTTRRWSATSRGQWISPHQSPRESKSKTTLTTHSSSNPKKSSTPQTAPFSALPKLLCHLPTPPNAPQSLSRPFQVTLRTNRLCQTRTPPAARSARSASCQDRRMPRIPRRRLPRHARNSRSKVPDFFLADPGVPQASP